MIDTKEADVNAELTADLVGDYLFCDEDFVRRLSTESRSVFDKIRDEIKYLCKVATAGSKELKELEKAKKLFEKVYREAEAKINTTYEGGVRYSISGNFNSQVDSWDRKTIGFSFVVGTTSDALIKAGIPDKQIRWDASKIKTTMETHKGMSLGVIKQVPNLLEKPVIVIDSKKDTQSKIVMGELYDDNGKIVTAVLKLNPSSKKGNQLDLIKLSSTQGRGHIESLFKYEDGKSVAIRYVDKNRIQNWLNVNRLQLPLHSFNLDSNNSVPNSTENVKKKGDFSLSSKDKAPKKYGDYAVYGEDIMLEGKGKAVTDPPSAEITVPTVKQTEEPFSAPLLL